MLFSSVDAADFVHPNARELFLRLAIWQHTLNSDSSGPTSYMKRAQGDLVRVSSKLTRK